MCPPGWDRVNWSAKNWGVEAPQAHPCNRPEPVKNEEKETMLSFFFLNKTLNHELMKIKGQNNQTTGAEVQVVVFSSYKLLKVYCTWNESVKTFLSNVKRNGDIPGNFVTFWAFLKVSKSQTSQSSVKENLKNSKSVWSLQKMIRLLRRFNIQKKIIFKVCWTEFQCWHQVCQIVHLTLTLRDVSVS